jgi:hypothetical protein
MGRLPPLASSTRLQIHTKEHQPVIHQGIHFILCKELHCNLESVLILYRKGKVEV